MMNKNIYKNPLCHYFILFFELKPSFLGRSCFSNRKLPFWEGNVFRMGFYFFDGACFSNRKLLFWETMFFE